MLVVLFDWLVVWVDILRLPLGYFLLGVWVGVGFVGICGWFALWAWMLLVSGSWESGFLFAICGVVLGVALLC